MNDTPAFEAVVPLVDAGEGDGELLGVWFGDGVPAGDGLGTAGGLMPFGFVALALLWLISAIAVPQPAMTTTRPTIAPMISSQGARCTIG